MRRVARALASAGTLTLLGCGDPTVSIGSNTGPSPVAPGAVVVNASPCPDGYEHATICCTGDNGQNAPACMRYIGTPFHPCAAGWLTYPNENVCCALDNPSDCTAPVGPKNASAIVSGGDCEPPAKCPPGTSPDPWCAGFGCWSYAQDRGGEPATRNAFCSEAKDAPSSQSGFPPSACVADCPPAWFPWSEPGVCCRGEEVGPAKMCFATARYVPLTKR